MSERQEGPEVWPDCLKIRDTKIYTDEGQRVYTTAGMGYERREYIRADLYTTLLAEKQALEAALARLEGEEWGDERDDLSDAVDAAHPVVTKNYDTWHKALDLISPRRSKYALVNLVNYLMVSAEAERDRLAQEEERLRDALRLIELFGYREGEEFGWINAHMRGTATAALEGQDLSPHWRLFPNHRPRTALRTETGGE